MIDPVCRMEFGLRDAAAMAVYQGQAYYFCSSGCRESFLADPEALYGRVESRRLTVGVMGSASGDQESEISQKALDLGRCIGESGLALVTGACPGLPLQCARGAREAGGLSVGISPALSLDEHLYKYQSPDDAFDVMVYTGSGLMGREVTNIRSSDMVIILGGRSGTLGEFSIAYDEGKLIGVLQGSGGITDQLPGLVASFGKTTGARLVYDADPRRLLQRLIDCYQDQHFQRPSCFCDDSSPADG